MTVSWRRSAEGPDWDGGVAVAMTGLVGLGSLAVSFAPHSAQNLEAGWFGLAQDGQRTSRATPQETQNLLVSGVSEWQLGHSMSAP